MWGFGRAATMGELGRALRLTAGRPGQSIRDMEREKKPISGPLSVAVEMMLEGALPPDGIPIHDPNDEPED
jgi:hypothetical protein